MGMKNVRQPMVCYFLKEDRKRGNRHHELMVRKTSVSLMSDSQTKKGEKQPQMMKPKVSESSIREDACDNAKQSEGDLAEHHTETDEEETFQKDDMDDQARSATTEGAKYASLKSPTESPVVWLVVPLLFAAIAVACFYWSEILPF